MSLNPSDAKGNSEHNGSILQNSVLAIANPITKEGDWPEPKRTTLSTTLIGGQGCVLYLRQRGIPVPQNPLIYAKYLPVDSTELPPIGVKVLLVSYMSPGGHVSWGYNDGKRLKVILDSDGIKEIPIGLYKGYIKV